MYKDLIAFDRSTVRTVDYNGHLHVSLTNISKANVCGYLGKEVPGWRELGLDSQKVYQMLRDPSELERSAKTFDGKPLLDIHVPVSAWDHPKGKVVGSVGTDGVFVGDYLKNSLTIWTSDAIADIESGAKREISCSYSYDADMTPGIYKGEHYDGIMRNIKANHVALVPQGRAGHDVLVADSLNQEIEEAMKRKSYTKSVLAQLASDAKVDKVEDLLSLLAADEEKEDKKDDKKAEDEETEEEKAARLKKEAAADEEEEEKKKADDEEESAEEKKKEKAMDAAIARAKSEAKAETKAEMRAMQEAVDLVKPWVGSLVAMDSAEEVYKAALAIKEVAVDGVHPSAYKALVQAHMQVSKPAPVMDSKNINGFYDIFPEAKNIKSLRG